MTNLASLAFGMPGVPEMLIILVIVVIIFGANKLPQVGDALGKGIQNFRKSMNGDKKKEQPPATPTAELPPETATAEKVEEVQARDVTPKE